MTTRTSLTSESEKITDGQSLQYMRLVASAAESGALLALEKVVTNRSGWTRVLGSGDKLREAILETVVSTTRELAITNESLLDWYRFYREMFGIEPDVSAIQIPAKRQGFDRLLVIAQGLSIQRVYDKCLENFGCWKYTDKSLDEIVTHNDRDPKNGTYAVWVRDRVEADEEHKNKSANDLVTSKTVGITLLERLIYELKYWKETGKHLDIKNWTLCSGSRNSDGDVPRMYWSDDDKLGVYWYDADDQDGGLRSREVV